MTKISINKIFLILIITLFGGSLLYMSSRDMGNLTDLRAVQNYPTIPPPPPPVTYIPPPPGAGCVGIADGTSCSTCDLTALTANGCSTTADGATGNCAAGYRQWCACEGGGCYPFETINGCSTSWVDNTGCTEACPAGSSCLAHNSYCSPCINSTHTCFTVTTTCVPSCGDTSTQCSGTAYSNGCGSNTCTGTGSGSCTYGTCTSCTLQCGQGRVQPGTGTCGTPCGDRGCGTCGLGDCGEASAPQSCSPNNVQASPLMVGSAITTLSWTNPLVTHNFNQWQLKLTRVGVGTSNYTLPPATLSMNTISLAPGSLYGWTVNAKSPNCDAVSGSNCPGTSTQNDGIGASLGGYFCYELTPGQVTMTVPVGSLSSPIAYPGALSVGLSWSNNEANHQFTNGYRVRVYDLSTGIMKTDTNVGSTLKVYTFTPVGGLNFSWTIEAYNDRCDASRVYGPISTGYFSFARAPTFNILNLRNVTVGWTGVMGNGTTLYNNGDFVNVETVSGIVSPVNHICQSNFMTQTGHQRDASFRVNMYDQDGAVDIKRIGLKLDGPGGSLTVMVDNVGAGWVTPAVLLMGTTNVSNNLDGKFSLYDGPVINVPDLATSAINMVAVIPLRFAANFPAGIYNLSVYALDNWGQKLVGSDANGWIDGGRDFKVWDCQVPVVGDLYDASSATDSQIAGCDISIYLAANKYNRTPNKFSYLGFPEYFPNGVGVTANITLPSAYQTNSPNHLVWGRKYDPDFNDDLDFPAADQHMQATDTGPGMTKVTCLNTSILNVGLSSASGGVATFMVNPYSNSPTMKVNFADIPNQLQWYQVVGGGIHSNTDLEYGVPATCANADPPGSCVPAMAISNSGKLDSGLVSSGLGPVNTNGCDTAACFFGYPNDSNAALNRNWFTQSAMVPTIEYNNLLTQIYFNAGIGVTVNNPVSWDSMMTSVGGTGVVFVSGDLNINPSSKTVVTTSPQYLVVIVNGNIIVDQSVTRLDGIYLSTGSFTAGGSNASQLVINGSIFGGGNVTFSRTYTNTLVNNTSPAVVIRYRPEYLFEIPQEVFYGLVNWSSN